MEEFTSQGAPPVANFASGTAGVFDTSGKFSIDVKDTCGKFPPISMTLVVNLPPVSMTRVANNGNNI